MRKLRFLFTCSFVNLSSILADHPAPEGHSQHNEAFNEGPRQAAYLMEGMPEIDFPVSTTNEKAQAFFNQGIGQLHGFWYFEAERSFRQVLLMDTNCVMAYWGMCMANLHNKERAAKLIQKGVASPAMKKLSEREKMWMKSLEAYYKDPKKDEKKRRRELIKAMESIVLKFPEDIEAKSFLTGQAWQNKSYGKMELNNPFAVSALGAQVLAKNPMHPTHHYLIHLWNYERDSAGLDSAARCGQAAPGIAHMWHMPGHIYSQLKRYHDAAWHQEASARVDHAHMMRDRVMPDQIHNFAHNNEWLARNLMYVGRFRDSLALSRNMIELPRLPTFKADKKTWDGSRSSYTRGQNRLLADLMALEDWDGFLQAEKDGYFQANDSSTRRNFLHAKALVQLQQGNTKEAETTLKQLRDLKSAFHEDRLAAVDVVETKARKDKKKDEELDNVVLAAIKPFRRELKKLEHQVAEIEVTREVQTGPITDELKEKVKTLKDVPKFRQARLMFAVGLKDEAEKQVMEAAKKAANQVLPKIQIIRMLEEMGKPKKAEEQLKELQKIAWTLDLEAPILVSIRPVMDRLDWKNNWRPEITPSADILERPHLDDLGPFRWQPGPAPDWTLVNADRKKVRLKDYTNRPVLLIFYLGAGCAHCMDQLNAFAPKNKAFHDAGIEIVAISTDSVNGLSETLEAVKDELSFPFTIVSDESLKHFKAYRAYDDFESLPLHGTFLIDAKGLVRWQDISYEPFMYPDFLLEESKRLLRIKSDRQAHAGPPVKLSL